MVASNKKLTLYVSVAWILTILALIARLLSRLLAYDEGIGYFTETIFPIAYRVLTILITIHALSALLIFRRFSFPDSALAEMKEPHVAEKIASMIASIAMLLVLIAFGVVYWINPLVTPGGLQLFGLITAILSLFFFLFFWAPSNRGKTLHILLGYAVILHFLYILCSSYFEIFTPMNNPVKILTQVCAIASILFLLGDLRFFLNIAKPAFFIGASTAVIGFGTISVLSGAFFRLPSDEYTIIYHISNATVFALLIYATIRATRFLYLCLQAEEADLLKDDPSEAVETDTVCNTEDAKDSSTAPQTSDDSKDQDTES